MRKKIAAILIVKFFLISCAPLYVEDPIYLSSSEGILEDRGDDFLQYINDRRNFINLLSDTIYENSSCYCGNNDSCTRGCSKNRSYRAGLRCLGRKARSKPTNWCMRHVLGAVMHSMDAFCQKSNAQSISRNQCIEEVSNIKAGDSKYNICRKSLAFPSALCALNLDGKNRINSNTIKNKYVRRRCLNHSTFNKGLKFFKIETDNSTEIAPIFIETPLTEDPEDLPIGAIVVLQSNDKNGHVEIKTDRKECEGSYCFCSDFCVSRKGGYEHPFKPLVAFKWNPLFVKHLGTIGE